jgi:hypothetical protein
MKIAINYNGKIFIATAEDGNTRSSESPINLAEQLIDMGVTTDDVTWDVWSLQNKFQDIMTAVRTKQPTWARLAECELWIRMSS